MDRVLADSKAVFYSDHPCQQVLSENPIPTEDSSLQPRLAGYSAQISTSTRESYLKQVVTIQKTSSSPLSIDDFSISNSPATTNDLRLPQATDPSVSGESENVTLEKVRVKFKKDLRISPTLREIEARFLQTEKGKAWKADKKAFQKSYIKSMYKEMREKESRQLIQTKLNHLPPDMLNRT
ncbi:hypothetical protein J7438_22590 [Thalassotalea sp. G20_0]|uniref:hypothetical protein n=1 Tax=Thalassotalea sp. G20_0 TaxID=2821093 RepID=UPI001ADCBCE7|nr:hypothetical protein [Thalassotalea sp. G20_0]MBO9496852.1 hypothetical protein [Thalassotalea sp. G20_0]